MLKMPKKRVRNEVRQLDEPRSLGINKHRHLGVIACHSKRVSGILELSRKRLNPLAP